MIDLSQQILQSLIVWQMFVDVVSSHLSKFQTHYWDPVAVADPAEAKRPCLPPPRPNSWPSEEKLWELLSSWLSVLTLEMIKFVVYSPPGKIMFSVLFCRNSSAFDWATVSLECQTLTDWADVLEVWTWTYCSAEANTQLDRIMHQNTHFKTQKWRTKFCGGALPPPETPPQWETPSPYHTSIYSQCLHCLY